MANILVYIETFDEQADPASLDVLSSMRLVASRLGATLYAVMPTVEPPVYGEDDIVAVISRRGADKVILLSHPSLTAPASFDSHGAAVLAATHRLPPSLLVFADTPGCRDVALGCGAALSAPVLVHPSLDLDEYPWKAQVAARFHEEARVLYLGDMDRPVVIVAAPGQAIIRKGDASDDAEVVVLSPKTTQRRLSATAVKPPAIPRPGSNLLLAGTEADLANQTGAKLIDLARRLRAESTFGLEPPQDQKDEARDPIREVGPGRAAPWAKGVVLFQETPAVTQLASLPGTADILWVSPQAGRSPFRAAAILSESPSSVIDELIALAPPQRNATEPDPKQGPQGNPIHFEPGAGLASEALHDSGQPTGQDQVETLVLLAGPAPRPEGPAMETLLALLEPARRAALALPAKERVLLCCGDARADDLLVRLVQGDFDRLVRIEPPIAGPLATKGLARLLAAAIRKLGARLVVAGDQGAEWNRGLTGPAVAQILDWAFLTGALGPFSLTPAGLLAHQKAWETLWAWHIEMPALLCVADSGVGRGTADPSKPTGEQPPSITVWNLEDLGLQEEDVVPLCKPNSEVEKASYKPQSLHSAQDVMDWMSAHRLKKD